MPTTTAKLNLELTLPNRAGAEVAALINNASAPHRNINAVVDLLTACAGGVTPAFVRGWVDDSTGVSAAATVTITYANVTAGDYLVITRNGKPTILTVVSTAPVAGDGTFRKVTNATSTGDSLVTAIGTHSDLIGHFTASNAVGVVTITRTRKGSAANSTCFLAKKEAAAGMAITAFTGGIDPGAKKALTATLGGALTANDTVTIGSVTLTAKASPANENEFVGAVSAAADGAALVACVNAHSKLKGLILASGTSTATLTLRQAGRIGALISVSKSAAQITLSAASFAPATTEAWVASPVEFAIGTTAA